MTTLFHETKGHGPDLVLLHGWGFHSGIWQPILQKLIPHFTVHLIDLPGFGRSPSIPNYTLEHVVTEILNVVPKRAIYLGWSLGGIIALALAHHAPSRIEKSILVASSPRFLEDDDWPGVKAQILTHFSHELQNNYHHTLSRFFKAQLRDAHLETAIALDVKNHLYQYGEPDAHSLNGGLHILQTADLRHEIKNIASPMLFILGRLDTMIPVAVADAIQTINPNAQCTILQKAGHIPFLSHAEEFIQHIMNFLK